MAASPELETSLPALPAELIGYIIRLSLPPLAFPTFRLRYDRLLAYSTVSSVWYEAAQAELYSDVWLGDLQKEDLLWELIGKAKKGWANRARTLWCGYEADPRDRRVYSAHFVDRALSYCPNVELVCLSALGLTAFDFSAFDRECRAQVKGCRANVDALGIKKLRCSWIELYGTGPAHIIPRPPNPLPSLTSLTLISPYLNGGLFGSWSNLLSPTTMPNLRQFALQVGESDEFQDHNEEYDSLPIALRSLGPQLETLHLLVGDIEITDGLLDLLPECTSLRFLRLYATERWCISDPEMYEAPKLPPSLRVLVIDPSGSFAGSSFLSVYEDLTIQILKAVRSCPALGIVALSDSWILELGSRFDIEYTPEMLEQDLHPLSSGLARQGKRLRLYRHDETDEWWQACNGEFFSFRSFERKI